MLQPPYRQKINFLLFVGIFNPTVLLDPKEILKSYFMIPNWSRLKVLENYTFFRSSLGPLRYPSGPGIKVHEKNVFLRSSLDTSGYHRGKEGLQVPTWYLEVPRLDLRFYFSKDFHWSISIYSNLQSVHFSHFLKFLPRKLLIFFENYYFSHKFYPLKVLFSCNSSPWI